MNQFATIRRAQRLTGPEKTAILFLCLGEERGSKLMQELKSTEINIWFSGQVMPRTKMTAKPRPTAVSTFLETARKEHIPRKKAKAMFSTKIAFVAKLK